MLFDIFEYFFQLVAVGTTVRRWMHDQNGRSWWRLYILSQHQQQIIPSLPRCSTSRDVDFIHRSFVVAELALYGMPDAAVELKMYQNNSLLL